LFHARNIARLQFVLPVFITTAELITIATLFFGIKIGPSSGLIIISPVEIGIAVITLTCLKVGLDTASQLTVLSQEFSSIGRIRKDVTKEEKCFFASCRSCKVRVGETFTITKETFPNIFGDIIIGSLINLLVIYK